MGYLASRIVPCCVLSMHELWTTHDRRSDRLPRPHSSSSTSHHAPLSQTPTGFFMSFCLSSPGATGCTLTLESFAGIASLPPFPPFHPPPPNGPVLCCATATRQRALSAQRAMTGIGMRICAKRSKNSVSLHSIGKLEGAKKNLPRDFASLLHCPFLTPQCISHPPLSHTS